jgi:antitoxin component YwqK of YwqJK toxin-antitoxin module
MVFAGLRHGSCKEWVIPKDVQVLVRNDEYFLDQKHGTSYCWKDAILLHIEQYSKGVLHGKSQYFYSRLDQFEEKTYSRGELIELKKYGKSGMIQHKILFPNMPHMVELCNIVDGHIDSSYTYDAETDVYTVTRFNSNNFIETIQNMKNGLLHGEYIEYFHESNKKRRVANFIEGKEHGESIIYHQNGIIAEIKNYQHDRAHGKMKSYNSDNALILECSYFGGYLNGTSKRYLGGRVIEDCYYVDGKLHGTFIQQMV